MDRTKLISGIKEESVAEFDALALRLFQYQYRHNEVYRHWVDALQVDIEQISAVEHIPFLPISAFKTYKLRCEKEDEELIFTSSGTTGSTPSRHYVYDLGLYLSTAREIFESFYGRVEDYCFLALLPSYLERSGSSLVAMVDSFIQASSYSSSGFYLYDHDKLYKALEKCKSRNMPTILFGVSFALLDFVEEYEVDFRDLIIMETGGMKGRKKELTREELHNRIAQGFGVQWVHSEYGMTELFSQAYSKGTGVYQPGRSMKVVIKDPSDPLVELENGRTGIINIIDLANVDSCAFVETQDLGRRFDDGRFEVLGRLDKSDIRGCNLMVGDES